MNFLEGIRRLGIAIGALLAIAGGFIYAIDRLPTEDKRGYAAADQITELMWNAQTLEYRASSYRYQMARELWPGLYGADLVKKACAEPRWPMFNEPCKAFDVPAPKLAWMWVTVIFETLGVAFMVAAVWGALWAVLMWVLGGFVHRSGKRDS